MKRKEIARPRMVRKNHKAKKAMIEKYKKKSLSIINKMDM
jgi:hypothetical protein